MFKNRRYEEIVRMVQNRGEVSVKELCETFDLSVVTIRSDLNELEKQGKIIRTHGGALAVEERLPAQPFMARRKINAEKKKRIGKAAANLVQMAELIFIDGGTTAVEMVQFLTDKDKVTVITPSVEVAYWLGVSSKINIYILNGFFRRDSLSTIGVPNLDILDEMNISKAFVGAAGITPEYGLTDLHMGFVEQKKVICEKARSIIGLVDYSKFGGGFTWIICGDREYQCSYFR